MIKTLFQLTLPGESYLKTHTLGWSILEKTQKGCLEITQDSIATKTIDLDAIHKNYTTCKHEMLLKYAKNFENVMISANKMTNNEVRSFKIFCNTYYLDRHINIMLITILFYIPFYFKPLLLTK